MLRKVFNALKDDSRKGDFVNLSNQDRKELNINYTDIEIENTSKSQWKKIIKSKTQIAALKYLSEENSQREKTKDIVFETLKMSPYLVSNKRTELSKIIFKIRSQTLDIK